MAEGISAGTLVAGKYRVLRTLGEGGMGIVVLAVHEPLGAKVALKILTKDGRTGSEETRFLLEAQAAAQLKSDYIARVTDFGALPDGRQFMAMEHLEGMDLEGYRTQKGRLDTAEACDFLIQACAGLAQAHAAGIIHRDLKPSNLFVTHTSDGAPAIKVLDFGVSKFQGALAGLPSITSTGLAVGTPLYMSPEQVKARHVDERSDVWALGVVLFELVSGRTPFYDDSLGMTLLNVLERPHASVRASGANVSVDLERIIDTCLSKEPEGRPNGVAELAELLAPFASEDGRRLAKRVRRIAERTASREHVSLTPASGAHADMPTLRAANVPLALVESGADPRPASTPHPATAGKRLAGSKVWVFPAIVLATLGGVAAWVAFVGDSAPSSPASDVESDSRPTASAQAAAPDIEPAAPIASLAHSASASPPPVAATSHSSGPIAGSSPKRLPASATAGKAGATAAPTIDRPPRTLH